MADTGVKSVLVGFFKSFKCVIKETPTEVIVDFIPEKIQKNFGLKEREIFVFTKNLQGTYVDENSDLMRKIKDSLKNQSSKTLLKLDFDFPKNINEKINLRNCSLSKIEKKHENNYFSRFSFLTTFRYLNKTEQVLNEIFVHEGKIVKGDLDSYNVKEGKVEEASTEHLAEDYKIAKETLKSFLDPKISEISNELNVGLENEIKRINLHYENLSAEFNHTNKKVLEKIRELESYGKKEDMEKAKKLKEGLNFDKEVKKIENEKKVVIDNEKTKHSLDVDNKLINTTVIYYPVFKINLTLSEAGFTKDIEVTYNPLTDELSNFVCDSCKTRLDQINVCHGGHICCSSCLHLCSECGKRYCRLCLAGVCDSCGKLVCKNCVRKCSDCGKLNCKNCMRVSGKSGLEKCQSCIAYCPGCSKLVEKKHLVRGSDGRMICRDCSKKK